MADLTELKIRDAMDLIGLPDDDVIAAEMSSKEFAELVGCTPRSVNMLAQDGILSRLPNGKFNTRDTIRAYITFCRKGASTAFEAARLREKEAAAEKLELANATTRHELLEATAVQREWANILRDIRASLTACPSRIGSRLPALTPHDIGVIDAEIRATLEALADGKSE